MVIVRPLVRERIPASVNSSDLANGLNKFMDNVDASIRPLNTAIGQLQQVPLYTTLPFIASSGVLNVGSPYAKAAYLKDLSGIVHVKGVCKAGAGGLVALTVFAQLPVGFRTAETQRFAVVGAGSTALQVLQIDNQGNMVLLINVAGAGTFDIACSFFAEK